MRLEVVASNGVAEYQLNVRSLQYKNNFSKCLFISCSDFEAVHVSDSLLGFKDATARHTHGRGKQVTTQLNSPSKQRLLLH